MKKKSKDQRAAEKINKKKKNVYAQSNRDAIGPATVICVAAKGHKTYQANSGAGGPGSQKAADFLGDALTVPWAGKSTVTQFPFVNCAEAKVWSLVMAADENPKEFIITSYQRKTNKMKTVAPCGNCKKWVSDAFKAVSKIDATY